MHHGYMPRCIIMSTGEVTTEKHAIHSHCRRRAHKSLGQPRSRHLMFRINHPVLGTRYLTDSHEGSNKDANDDSPTLNP